MSLSNLIYYWGFLNLFFCVVFSLLSRLLIFGSSMLGLLKSHLYVWISLLKLLNQLIIAFRLVFKVLLLFLFFISFSFLNSFLVFNSVKIRYIFQIFLILFLLFSSNPLYFLFWVEISRVLSFPPFLRLPVISLVSSWVFIEEFGFIWFLILIFELI